MSSGEPLDVLFVHVGTILKVTAPYFADGKLYRNDQWNAYGLLPNQLPPDVGADAATPARPAALAATSKNDAAILRLWRARSTVDKAPEYVRHATTKVFPALLRLEGHRGAYLLRRAIGGAVELLVLTLWDSMAAVRRFAGAEPDKAVVEPEVRRVLTEFDESVTHFEVVHRTERL